MQIMKDFIQQKLYDTIDFYKEKTLSSSRQSLWHAIKLENAVKVLEDGYLQAHTSHRYWPDGRRYKEDHPLYEDSYWMYGWSMTRKREYAEGWNGILIEFDAEKIAQTFEIQPLAWNNLFKHNKKFVKKEFEDFVIAHYEPRSIQNMKDLAVQRDEEIDKIYDKIYHHSTSENERERLKEQVNTLEDNNPSWMEDWKTPRGKKLMVNKCIKGIYMDEFIFDLYSKDGPKSDSYKKLMTIISHPLFKGLYKDPHKRETKTNQPTM